MFAMQMIEWLTNEGIYVILLHKDTCEKFIYVQYGGDHNEPFTT